MSQLRTITRSTARAANLPPWARRNQPAHRMREVAYNYRPDTEGWPVEAIANQRAAQNHAKAIRRGRR